MRRMLPGAQPQGLRVQACAMTRQLSRPAESGLVPRLERGDGRGCPILAIAITERCPVMPSDSIEDEVKRLAAVAKPVPEDCSEDGED